MPLERKMNEMLTDRVDSMDNAQWFWGDGNRSAISWTSFDLPGGYKLENKLARQSIKQFCDRASKKVWERATIAKIWIWNALHSKAKQIHSMFLNRTTQDWIKNRYSFNCPCICLDTSVFVSTSQDLKLSEKLLRKAIPRKRRCEGKKYGERESWQVFVTLFIFSPTPLKDEVAGGK